MSEIKGEDSETQARCEADGSLHVEFERLKERVRRGERLGRLQWFAAIALGLVAGSGSVVAQQTGLIQFQAGGVASAADVNGNFSLLQSWIEEKVGTVGTSAITATGNISTTGTVTAGGEVQAQNFMRVFKSAPDVAGDTFGYLAKGGTDFGYFGQIGRTAGDRNGWDTGIVWGDNANDMLRFVYRDMDGVTKNEAAALDSQGNLTLLGGLTAGGKSLDTHIRDYIASHCTITLGHRDGCSSSSCTTPDRTAVATPDNTYAYFTTVGDVDSNDRFFLRWECN